MSGDSIRGHLEMLLLAVIADSPTHGYGVAEELRTRSDGTLDLPEGSIYPALYRLEKAGLLQSRWSVVDGRRRRVYAITGAGKSALVAKRWEWATFADAVGAVLGSRPWPATN